ncbi:SH3 domain-binding protein 5-like isoform X2 [Scleropages formosus]|uniref:SH3 domain-binding protein 5 n=1 Tax=Scleropages formosus TaxID=113540 RepID=A0A8C9TBR7_SCLFO|nr:SH3 domain-binding protein 5-like isoform X2 [Scleropages formosus]
MCPLEDGHTLAPTEVGTDRESERHRRLFHPCVARALKRVSCVLRARRAIRATQSTDDMDRLEKGNKSEDDSESPEEEEVDPRIQDGRQKFRAVLVEATLKLDDQVKKIGRAVEESKPYWEARRAARQAQLEAQRATQDYQRAMEVLRAAKETIALAEQRLLEEDSRQFDSAWQEMLNHATQRVMEAEQTKTRSELAHKETAARYSAAISHMKQLEKKLKRTIGKSRPYFELKAKYYLQLEQLKKQVEERQARLSTAKGEYKAALRNLEKISDEIHERRRSSALECRGHGVGSDGDGGCADDDDNDDDIANFRMESDGISMVSVSIEDETCHEVVPGEDSGNPSICSLAMGRPRSCSTSRPGTLDLPGGLTPHAPGPRSDCSGASSPECDPEPGDPSELQGDPVCLEKPMDSLSLQQSSNTKRDTFTVAPSLAPSSLLVNGV